jgi:SAM-dependent methyltransferase
MNRIAKLLGGIPKEAKLVEIGPLCRPLVTRPKFNVFYVDYASRDYLIERYKNDPNVDLEKIVEVDGIWGEASLKQATQSFGPVDCVLASHVIEHVPNLIAWLGEIQSILKVGGTLALAVPDQRYTFDYLRRPSQLPDLLDSYFQNRRVPSARDVFDHLMYFSVLDAKEAWAGRYPQPPLEQALSLEEAAKLADSINLDGAYHDVHCLVFTPLSFVTILFELASYRLHSFACEQFFDTERNDMEFILRLRYTQDHAQVMQSWNELKHMLSKNAKAIPNSRAGVDSLSSLMIGIKRRIPQPIKTFLRQHLFKREG